MISVYRDKKTWIERSALSVFLILSLLTSSVCLGEVTKVKIGAILHLTGEFAIQGAAFREGVELAIDDLNNSKLPIQFEAMYEDSQYLPLASLTAAKRLASTKDVVGVVVSTVLEAKSAGNVFEQTHLPTIVLWDSSPELDQIGDYVFGIGPWAPDSGRKAASFACNELKAKKAVVMNTNTEWSVYVSDWFAKEFKRQCGEITAHFSVDPAETDFRTLLLKAKTLSPDVMYVPIDSNILPFFKQLRQIGIKAPLITSDIMDAELFGEAGDMLEGVYQTMAGDPQFPATTEMKEKYQKKFGHAPEYLMLTAWGYDAVKVIGQLAAEQGASRESVQAGLYKLTDYAGAGGPLTFTAQGSAPREVKVFVVRGQKLVNAN